MARHCFLLQVRPELLPEYRERHAAVWPEMLEALERAGWHNYSIFARDDGLLVFYVETDDFDAAQQAMLDTDVNTRWQADMARFVVDPGGSRDGRRPDDGIRLLDEVFHLEDQLAAVHQDRSER